MMMRALKPFDYMGRRFRPGDVFEPAADAIEGLALAELAAAIEDEKPRRKKPEYKTRRMQAEDE